MNSIRILNFFKRNLGLYNLKTDPLFNIAAQKEVEEQKAALAEKASATGEQK